VKLGPYLSYYIGGGKDALSLMRNSSLAPSAAGTQHQQLLLLLLLMTLQRL